jgi:hypothetical protein
MWHEWGRRGTCIGYKPERKRPLGRPRRRFEDNIKMDLVMVELGGVDWIGLAQDRYRRRTLVNAVMSLRVPSDGLHAVIVPSPLRPVRNLRVPELILFFS